jgi:hypothetical protein
MKNKYTIRKFKEQLAYAAIQTIGEQEIFSLIEQSKNELSKMQYKRLKKKVMEIINSNKSSCGADNFNEPLKK